MSPLKLFAALFVALPFHVLHLARVLPDRVASHFGAGGAADGWMPKSDFLTFYGMLAFVVGMLFLGLPLLLRILPPSLINVPHREYWLAPERVEQTVTDLGRQLGWLGAATLVFLMLLMELVAIANGRTPPALPGGFIVLLGGYLALEAALVISMIRRYSRRPPR